MTKYSIEEIRDLFGLNKEEMKTFLCREQIVMIFEERKAKARDIIEFLLNKVERYETALKFYADEKNYYESMVGREVIDNKVGWFWEDDKGEIARQALLGEGE